MQEVEESSWATIMTSREMQSGEPESEEMEKGEKGRRDSKREERG